jgi:hypothetical protein
MRNIYLAALLALTAGSLLAGPAEAQSQFFRIERGIDRPGNDISSAPSPDANACSFACQASNVCRAFTFVRPGVFGPTGVCFLKAPVPRRVRNNCCTSGVRQGAPVPIDR